MTTNYCRRCVSLDSLTFIVSGRELEHRILSEAKAPPDTTFAARRDPMANMMIWLSELKPGVISLLEGDFAMILASRRLAYSSSSISVAIAYDVISSPQLDRVSPNESTCTYFGIMIPARWNLRRNAPPHSVEVDRRVGMSERRGRRTTTTNCRYKGPRPAAPRTAHNHCICLRHSTNIRILFVMWP